MLEESCVSVPVDITRAFGFVLHITPTLLLIQVVRWCLLKMCTGSHSSHIRVEDQCVCVCGSQPVWVEYYYCH